MQDDDLLAKDDILREEGGAGLENRTECAQHGLEDFDKHRGKLPTHGRISAATFWTGRVSHPLDSAFGSARPPQNATFSVQEHNPFKRHCSFHESHQQ
jgi:hypothetical protein